MTDGETAPVESREAREERAELVRQVGDLQEGLVERRRLLADVRREGGSPLEIQNLVEMEEEAKFDLASAVQELAQLDVREGLRHSERMALAAERSAEASANAARWSKWAAIAAAAGVIGQLAVLLLERHGLLR